MYEGGFLDRIKQQTLSQRKLAKEKKKGKEERNGEEEKKFSLRDVSSRLRNGPLSFHWLKIWDVCSSSLCWSFLLRGDQVGFRHIDAPLNRP